MRIASIAIIVPVPLSVAPDDPSHESKCAESITYSFGFSDPLMRRDRVEHRLLAEERRVEIEAHHRLLFVFRETEHEAVVLAIERDCRRDCVVRLENFSRAPAAAALRRASVRQHHRVHRGRRRCGARIAPPP